MVSELGTILGCCDLRVICGEDPAAVVRMPLSCEPNYLNRVFAMLISSQQVGLAEGTFYPAVHTVLGGW